MWQWESWCLGLLVSAGWAFACLKTHSEASDCWQDIHVSSFPMIMWVVLATNCAVMASEDRSCCWHMTTTHAIWEWVAFVGQIQPVAQTSSCLALSTLHSLISEHCNCRSSAKDWLASKGQLQFPGVLTKPPTQHQFKPKVRNGQTKWYCCSAQ